MMEQQQPRFHLSHVGVPVYRHLDPTQPSLLPLEMDSAPVRLDRTETHVLPAFPRPLSTYLHTPRFPYIRRFCSLVSFLFESASSLAWRLFSCISRVLSAYSTPHCHGREL